MTSKIVYQGGLRTQATHVRSGTTIITDAPTDNHGKGKAFSPTDLVATALASCILTIMGIVAKRIGTDIKGAEASVTKIMQAKPRKIAAIEVEIAMPKHITYSDKEKQILERTAQHCPVCVSLAEDMRKTITFVYS